jgi:hypothetical protein
MHPFFTSLTIVCIVVGITGPGLYLAVAPLGAYWSLTASTIGLLQALILLLDGLCILGAFVIPVACTWSDPAYGKRRRMNRRDQERAAKP